MWNTCFFFFDLNRGECAAWVQAWGSIFAVIAALAVVVVQHVLQVQRESQAHLRQVTTESDARKRTRDGHFRAMAAEVDLCRTLAATFLEGYEGKPVAAPAYRAPMIAYTHSLPALLTDGAIGPDDLDALMHFYVTARSFNLGLDSAHELRAAGKTGEMLEEYLRTRLKADELVPAAGGARPTHYDRAVKVLATYIEGYRGRDFRTTFDIQAASTLAMGSSVVAALNTGDEAFERK